MSKQQIKSLADLMPQATKMELVHPTRGPLGIYLEVIGQDSKPFRDLGKRLMKARLGKKDGPVDVDQLEKDNAELAAACIVGWTDDQAFDGPYSPARAIELMAMPELSWIREEVEAFVRERSNFFLKAAGKPPAGGAAAGQA
jgi:hypothetical protein